MIKENNKQIVVINFFLKNPTNIVNHDPFFMWSL